MSSIKDKKLPLKQLNKRIEDPKITELKLAAIDGDYEAIYELVLHYFNDGTFEEDFAVIIKLLKKAASKGVIKASNLVGALYLAQIVPSDDPMKEAMKWYKMGADKHDTEAMNELGRLYLENDLNGEDKSAEGLEMVLNVAEQGYAQAQLLMGILDW